MNDAITFLENIQSGFKKMKLVTLVVAGVCTIVSLGSIAAALWFAQSQREQVYVLDEGAVLSAFRTDNGAQRDLELGDQYKRFLQLFFNVAPNVTTIETNINQALELADESASNYYFDLREKQYYSRLINDGASQSIDIDSVKVNVFDYPYRAKAYGRLYTIRATNISETPFESSCVATESQRTQKNVHGLLISRWSIKFGEPVVRNRNN